MHYPQTDWTLMFMNLFCPFLHIFNVPVCFSHTLPIHQPNLLNLQSIYALFYFVIFVSIHVMVIKYYDTTTSTHV